MMILEPSLLSDRQTIEHAIAPNPLTVSPDTPLMEVIALMSQARGFCSLPDRAGSAETTQQLHEARSGCILVTEQQQILGIFTERDVVRLTATGQSLENIAISDVMTQPVITMPRSAIKDIFSIIDFLRHHQIRHLPVVDQQGQAIGLLTLEGVRGLLQPADLLRLRIVSEVMTTEVIQAYPSTPILELASLMATHKVSCVVIVENSPRIEGDQQSCHPVGIVTERDIVQFQALGLDFRQVQAQSVMSSPLFCLKPEDSLWAAHQAMQQYRVRRIVVANNQGEMVGILTQTSLLNILSPLEVYSLIEVLQQKVNRLEAERIELLQNQAEDLAHQVEARTTEFQQQVECDRLLANLSSQIYQSFDLSEILRVTVEQVRQYLRVERVIVCRFNPDWASTVVAESVATEWRSLLGNTIQDSCFAPDWINPYLNGRVRLVEDIFTDGMASCHRDLLVDLQVRAKVLVPIIHGGQLWGLLSAHQCSAPRHWSNYEVETLQKLATQLAIAIQQAELYERTQVELSKRQKSETALKNLVEGTASVTGKDFFTVLVRYIADALEVRHAAVSKQLSNGEMQTLALWSDGQLQTSLLFDPTNLPCGITFKQGRYSCPEQVQQRFPQQPFLASLQAESYQGVALNNANGQPIGTLCILHDQKLTDPNQVEAILRVFGARAAAELERQEAIEALEQLNQELEDRVEQRTAALRESEARFRLMADSAPVLLWMSDTTTQCNFFNQTWLHFTGRSLTQELGTGWAEGVHPEDLQHCLETYLNSCEVQQSFQMEYRLRRHDGEYRWILDTGTPRFSPDGGFEGYIGSCIDISDRRQAEQQLQRQLAAIEAAIDGIAILNPNDQYVYLNSAYLHLSGYNHPDDLANKTWRDLYSAEEVNRFEREIFPILGRDRHWSGEAIATRRDGSTFAEEVSLTLIEGGDLVCVCRDITDRKQTEVQLKSSLQEKELLLKEIHHRVKNNLLVVASLLDWQTDYIDNPTTLKIFEESQHRIHSMALIHEKLYQSQNLDQIDLGEYLKALAEHLICSFELDPNRIQFQYQFEPIFLNIETATPCGLIVSELISNTLEHGFPENRTGQVWIEARKNEHQQITVSIRDNGVGFPETINFRNTESLGLQLISLLTKQIQGEVELIPRQGTEFQLTFSELNYRRRL